jgi:hypothetical protein
LRIVTVETLAELTGMDANNPITAALFSAFLKCPTKAHLMSIGEPAPGHRPMAEWDVLIKDHHEAYITWDEFERNQRVIANNATGKGRQLPGRRADLRREWREIP